MNSVIIICDDPRIALVRETLQPLLTAKICVVANFDAGLKVVFEKQPLVVFIQDEIDGVRGETVSRHVKSLLQGNAPQFITLDHAAVFPGLVRDFNDGINLNHPVEELITVFRKHLLKLSGISWTGQAPQASARPAPPPSADRVYELPLLERHGVPVSEQSSDSLLPVLEYPPLVLVVDPFSADSNDSKEPPASALPLLDAPSDLPVSLPRLMPIPAARECLLFPAVELPPPVVPAPAEVASPLSLPERPRMTGRSSGRLPFPVNSAPERSRVSHKTLVALLFAAGLILFISFGARPLGDAVISISSHPRSAAATPDNPPPNAGRKVPSFIPKGGFDPFYGSDRPGWEHYISKRREYFIFRQQKEIKALQMVALKNGALSHPFVSSALLELCGSATIVSSSRSIRDGYLIQQGESATGAGVTIYKKRESGEIRALVITFP